MQRAELTLEENDQTYKAVGAGTICRDFMQRFFNMFKFTLYTSFELTNDREKILYLLLNF